MYYKREEMNVSNFMNRLKNFDNVNYLNVFSNLYSFYHNKFIIFSKLNKNIYSQQDTALFLSEFEKLPDKLHQLVFLKFVNNIRNYVDLSDCSLARLLDFDQDVTSTRHYDIRYNNNSGNGNVIRCYVVANDCVSGDNSNTKKCKLSNIPLETIKNVLKNEEPCMCKLNFYNDKHFLLNTRLMYCMGGGEDDIKMHKEFDGTRKNVDYSVYEIDFQNNNNNNVKAGSFGNGGRGGNNSTSGGVDSKLLSVLDSRTKHLTKEYNMKLKNIVIDFIQKVSNVSVNEYIQLYLVSIVNLMGEKNDKFTNFVNMNKQKVCIDVTNIKYFLQTTLLDYLPDQYLNLNILLEWTMICTDQNISNPQQQKDRLYRFFLQNRQNLFMTTLENTGSSSSNNSNISTIKKKLTWRDRLVDEEPTKMVGIMVTSSSPEEVDMENVEEESGAPVAMTIMDKQQQQEEEDWEEDEPMKERKNVAKLMFI